MNATLAALSVAGSRFVGMALATYRTLCSDAVDLTGLV